MEIEESEDLSTIKLKDQEKNNFNTWQDIYQYVYKYRRAIL